MGIVNAGPDSFSDAVRLTTLEGQVAHARRLVAEGADIVDVGGESGVTYTPATAAEVEIARVVPLVERLAAEGVAVSVDTWKPAVAEAALDAGAAMINDTSGLADLRLAELCAQHRGGARRHAHAGGAEAGALRRLRRRRRRRRGRVPARALRRRAARPASPTSSSSSIPGPDFAKTPAETVAVLRAIDRVAALGRPLLLAVSRKYFVGAITGRPPARPAGRDARRRRVGGGRRRGHRAGPRRRRDGRLPARAAGARAATRRCPRSTRRTTGSSGSGPAGSVSRP